MQAEHHYSISCNNSFWYSFQESKRLPLIYQDFKKRYGKTFTLEPSTLGGQLLFQEWQNNIFTPKYRFPGQKFLVWHWCCLSQCYVKLINWSEIEERLGLRFSLRLSK